MDMILLSWACVALICVAAVRYYESRVTVQAGAKPRETSAVEKSIEDLEDSLHELDTENADRRRRLANLQASSAGVLKGSKAKRSGSG